MTMKRAGKRHTTTKRRGSGTVGELTRLERERRALAEAAPPKRIPIIPPPPRLVLEIGLGPTPSADRAERANTLAPSVATRLPAPLPTPANDRSVTGPETRASGKATRVGWSMRREAVAFIAVVIVAVCGVVLLRECEPMSPPVQDDATATDSCSGDASVCVARA
jgi:hypothetical protein